MRGAKTTRPKHRPRSLAEAAQTGRASGEIDASLREFLDEFYSEAGADRRAMMLAEEPPLVANDRENAISPPWRNIWRFAMIFRSPLGSMARRDFSNARFSPPGLSL